MSRRAPAGEGRRPRPQLVDTSLDEASGSRPPSKPWGRRRTWVEQLKSACTRVPRLLPSRPDAPGAPRHEEGHLARREDVFAQAHSVLALRVRSAVRRRRPTGSSSTGTTAYAPLRVAAVGPAEIVERLPSRAEPEAEVGGKGGLLRLTPGALTKDARISCLSMVSRSVPVSRAGPDEPVSQGGRGGA